MADTPTVPTSNGGRPPRKTVESEMMRAARSLSRAEAKCTKLRQALRYAEDAVRAERMLLRQLIADLAPGTVESLRADVEELS